MKKIELENYIRKNMDRAGFTKLDIVKTPLVTRIIVNVTHPGLAIGKSGQNIKRLTLELGEKFKIENPQLEIQEIKVPELDAKATADRLKMLLERGYSWRSIAYKVVHDISMKGAQGVELVLAGALGGKGERKRKQRIATGYMKKTGDQVKLVDYAKVTAYPKYGAIGIKLRIVHPDTVFPDKINLKELFAKRQEAIENATKKAEEALSTKTEGTITKPLEFETEKVKAEDKQEEKKKTVEKKEHSEKKEAQSNTHEKKEHEAHSHKEHETHVHKEEKKEAPAHKEHEKKEHSEKKEVHKEHEKEAKEKSEEK